MQLRIFITILLSISYLFSFSQSFSELKFHKFITKNYRYSDSISTFCKENVATVYVEIKENKVTKIFSNNELGNLIVSDLEFIKKYNFTFKEEKKIGIFFILKNIKVSCIDSKKGYNETSLIIENILNEIYANRSDVFYLFNPIEIFVRDAIE